MFGLPIPVSGPPKAGSCGVLEKVEAAAKGGWGAAEGSAGCCAGTEGGGECEGKKEEPLPQVEGFLGKQGPRGWAAPHRRWLGLGRGGREGVHEGRLLLGRPRGGLNEQARILPVPVIAVRPPRGSEDVPGGRFELHVEVLLSSAQRALVVCVLCILHHRRRGL